uniref:Matrix protein n=1 Tax=Human respirovirus 3 TaxID=11216 RepID=T1UFR1_9MONO|nr:matrix protein [Human respirovirus 3]BEI32403.1 matrix protein [Respirovirus pneumoniae]ARA15337.1 matrix protein [Human respirovirus 3]ATN45416.1 matrix protein [Human respirovirus 3]AWD85041.1 matrix protein [Human respirovirus 3]
MSITNSAIYTFPESSFSENGHIEPLPLKVNEQRKAVPHIRVAKIGNPPKHGSRYLDVFLLGFFEMERIKDKYGSVNDLDSDPGYKVCGSGSLPIGLAKYTGNDQELLQAATKLDIEVRRTVKAKEMVVYTVQNIKPELYPWSSRLRKGMLFDANKVALAPQCLPLDRSIKFRVIFVNCTAIGSITLFKIPKSMASLSLPNTISINLQVHIKTGVQTDSKGVVQILDEKGEKSLNFMVHLGLIKRKVGRMYSVEYCKQKIEKMRLIFSLGLVGGISLHVNATGSISKTLASQLVFKREICYPLMDLNPHLNLVIWASSVEITRVDAIFQPSLPGEFRYYPNIIAKGVGKIKQWN